MQIKPTRSAASSTVAALTRAARQRWSVTAAGLVVAEPSPQRTVLLLGATGLVGGHVLRLLAADPSFIEVLVVGRREMLLPEGNFRQLVASAATVDELRNEFKVGTVFCCLGTTETMAGGPESFRRIDHDYVVKLAEIALGNGAHTFVLISSLGANPASRAFYLRVKGETERDVGALGYRTLHILRPSLLLGPRRQPRTSEEIERAFFRAVRCLMMGRLRKFRPIEADRVARAMVAFAKEAQRGLYIHENDALQRY